MGKISIRGCFLFLKSRACLVNMILQIHELREEE